MAELVEGEWKDFVFKMAKPEDYPKILDLLRKNFYPNEVLCSKLCSGEEMFNEMAEDFAPWVVLALKDNLSFFAEHKETKEVAGVRVSSLTKKGENPDFPPMNFPANPIIINFLTKASVQADIFSVYPDVDAFADFFMTATAPQFRGQGLATEMYNRAILLFQANGIQLCKSVLTSPWTRKACKNLNFTEHVKLLLQDYKDQDGKQFFPDATPDQFITVVSKRI